MNDNGSSPSKRAGKAVTVTDIARAIGVSRATVRWCCAAARWSTSIPAPRSRPNCAASVMFTTRAYQPAPAHVIKHRAGDQRSVQPVLRRIRIRCG